MTRRTDAEIVAALGPLLADARSGLERRIEDARVVPDLQDAVRRAHALDPTSVPQSWVVASRDVSLLPDTTDDAAVPESPVMQAFLDDAAEEVESWTRERRMAPIPKLRREKRRWPWLVGGLAMAAALVVGVALTGQLTAFTAAESDEETRDAAEMIGVRDDADGVATRRAPKRRQGPKVRTPEPPPPDPEPDIVIVEEDDGEPETAPPKPAARRRGRLQAMDAEAKTLWEAGDLEGAERKLESIIARGGKSQRAELAFGDLLSLAPRLHGVSGQRKLWKRYLAKFPRGHHVDDARAGLCRTAAVATRPECWAQYLRDLPEGSFRAEARRVVESSEPSETPTDDAVIEP